MLNPRDIAGNEEEEEEEEEKNNNNNNNNNKPKTNKQVEGVGWDSIPMCPRGYVSRHWYGLVPLRRGLTNLLVSVFIARQREGEGGR